jgi:hypothetical protein
MVCTPVVADLHHFGVMQDPDPDPDPHQSEELDPDPDPDPHQSEELDPDLHQNIQRDQESDPHHSVLDPQHWFKVKIGTDIRQNRSNNECLPGDHLWFSCLLLMLEYLIFYAGKLCSFSLQCLCFPRRNHCSSCNISFLEFFTVKFT